MIQIHPVYQNDCQTDQLFLLTTDISETNTSLKINVVSSTSPVDSAVNIARINPDLEGAHHEARFAEIKYENTEKEDRHLFVTLAYQSSPVKTNHMTISEATYKDGKW